jgi:hypothetical protein
MPEALTDVGWDVCGEKERDALGFLSMRDPKGLEAECPASNPAGRLTLRPPSDKRRASVGAALNFKLRASAS